MTTTNKKNISIANFTPEKDEKNNNDCITYCGLTCMLCLFCVFFCLYITCVVFSIIGLTEISDQTIRKEHCGSLLWRYVLTMIILLLIQSGSSLQIKNDDDSSNSFSLLFSLIFTYILSIIMVSWGSYELWGRDCSASLTKYTLYVCAYNVVILQFFILAVITIGTIIYLFLSCYYINKLSVKVDTDEDKKLNNV